MRSLPLGILMWLAACATVEPEPISLQQRLKFQQTVRSAEERLAIGDCSQAAAVRLREAKSDFYYAEHSPSAPLRAKRMAVKAQKDAEAALEMMPRSRPRDLALESSSAPQHPK